MHTKHLISQNQRFKGIIVVFLYAEAQNCHTEEEILCWFKISLFYLILFYLFIGLGGVKF